MASNLSDKLLNSFNLKDETSFFKLKELLDIAARALSNDGVLPSDPNKLAGFSLAQECLIGLRKGRKNLTRDGILYKGRPSFITDDLLQALQYEMEELRSTAKLDRWDQYISQPGPLIRGISESKELLNLVQELVGPVHKEVDTTCMYYDKAGAQIPPHVDVDNFSVNANLLITHKVGGEQKSDFILYPVGSDPHRLIYRPGDLLIFYADCIVHSRTPIAKGEKVHAVSIGFRPMGELHMDER